MRLHREEGEGVGEDWAGLTVMIMYLFIIGKRGREKTGV
jgi:hypothetical protein